MFGLAREEQSSLAVKAPVRPAQTGRAGERDRDNPTIWEAMAVDPNLHVPWDSLAAQVRNNQRWSRRHLYGVVRIWAMLTIRICLLVKRMLPFDLASERAMNWIGPRFLRRFCSPETLDFVLRHFAIESNLINFVAANSGADDVQRVSLSPRSAAEVSDNHGMNAIVRHDANIFNLVIDLGESDTADVHTRRRLEDIDFSMIAIPEFDLEPGVRRWMNLDMSIAAHITVATLAFFMDYRTAERAVNSFQLDESMLASIANITGDPVFRTWPIAKYPTWLGMTRDVGRDLHLHMIANEYAHTRLQWMSDARDTA
ncbi:MAG TPA: hypothetical protein VLI04_11320 [Nocardioidaceae bacterium]|nr:hypothetical protein [Nocardioidaceae bacterium]